MALMRHSDYLARVDYDEEIDSFHGRIINISDVVTFYGRDPEELKREFAASLAVYLDLCRERGKDPDKPYPESFKIRMSPQQYRCMAEAAEANNQSLDVWALETLRRAAEQES